jgi:hypothetical protein
MPSGVYPRKSWEERFWGKVNKQAQNGCWEWTSALNDNGYGVMWLAPRRTAFFAHRLSYEMHFGAFDEERFICHHCDNPKCVRPDHLFIGDAADNSHDMCQKGRQRNGCLVQKGTRSTRFGTRVNFAKLNEDKVFRIKRLMLKGVTAYRIAQWLGLTYGAISLIKKGKNWKHVPNPRHERDTYEAATV